MIRYSASTRRLLNSARSASLLFKRGARTRTKANRGRPNDPTAGLTDPSTIMNQESVKIPTDTEGAQKRYFEQFKKEVAKRGMERVDVRKDMLILDMLNNSKPGSAMDARFKSQQKELESLTNDHDKLRSLATFLSNEIKYELSQPEEFNEDVNVEGDVETMLEYELRQFLAGGRENDLEENSRQYLKFKVLAQLMEDLLKERGGMLVLAPEFTVEVFQLSQFIQDDEDLRMKMRYLSGKLIYGLKKFEFDYLSESQFIEALILNGENSYAATLLNKRSSKVNQRFWDELMVVNSLEKGNLSEAESLVKTIAKKFNTAYLDSRIFHMFIDKYSETNNVESLKTWIDRYMKLIDNMGGFVDPNSEGDESPRFNLDEEAALKLLNAEQQAKPQEFFKVIEILLKEETNFNPALVSKLIHFYLSQPNTDSMDLIPLLSDLRFKFKSRIAPVLTESSPKIEELKNFFDEFREQSEIETSQSDFLEDIFKKKGRSGMLEKITGIEKFLETNGRLTSRIAYHLLVAFLKTGRVEEASQILRKMELVTLETMDQSILPKADAKHYLPFLAHYGRTGKYEDFMQILDNFSHVPGLKLSFNPIILTQVLNSLMKMKKFEESVDLINQVLVNDIHRADTRYVKSEDFKERKFYSTMWKSVKDILVYARSHPEEIKFHKYLSNDFPNLRLLFMKMIHDKVIPNLQDYCMIISSFLLNREKYSVLCVLRYMKDKHNLELTPQIVKILNRYNDAHQKQPLSASEQLITGSNSAQDKALNKLHLQGYSSGSFDPFASKSSEASNIISPEDRKDEPLLDLNEEVVEKPSKIESIEDWEYHYFKTIKSIMQQRNSNRFNLKYCSKIFNDFELLSPTIKEINELFDKFEPNGVPIREKIKPIRVNRKRIAYYKTSKGLEPQ